MSTKPKDQSISVILSDPQVSFLLERVLQSAGYKVDHFQDQDLAMKHLEDTNPALVILSDKLDHKDGLATAQEIISKYPALPVMLFVHKDNPDLLKKALRMGIKDYLCVPLRSEDILRSVETTLVKSQQLRDWVLLESRRTTDSLRRRVDELETLARLGQTITASLDSEGVLSAIVEAAVELTGAEEGSLLMLDAASGELYMRAAKNFQEDFVQTFRLPIQDTLAGSVLKSGQPVVLDESTPQKIKTAYLVHALIYVPLKVRNSIIGVLGVDNRHSRLPFQKRDVNLLSTLAEYAIIAIENANQYHNTQIERNKRETVLKRIQDGVIVIDQNREVILINQAAEAALGLNSSEVIGQHYRQVLNQPELLELMDTSTRSLSNRTEVAVEDGRVFSAQRTPITDVGTALTLHDITYLKKLDRIKSEFISTVSHDLRSPLTAILGYAELVERAGPVNELQQEFIRRVQTSVQNITHLVDDLVNLGRIEAGFDTRKESFDLRQLLEMALENFRKALARKGNDLVMDIPATLPPFFGNPVQIRQMFEHLLDNAIKYSPQNGKIHIYGEVEQNQIILQVKDEGIGIPSADLPYIFDKFYRAANISSDSSGTGLGLAIVKSIVESHEGRIWVDSTVGEGAVFTIVLPKLQA